MRRSENLHPKEDPRIFNPQERRERIKVIREELVELKAQYERGLKSNAGYLPFCVQVHNNLVDELVVLEGMEVKS